MRVIAGTRKGRELSAPKGMNTRPTLAKVKEAMFGMIQFDIEGAEVLDLFAGSGSLGIEALSRGAKHAVFCDADRQAVSVIKDNLKRLDFINEASVYYGDSLKLLDTIGTRFNIVLLDPPYESGLETEAVRLLDEKALLEPGAIVLAEHSKEVPPVFTEAYTVLKTKKYGDTYVTYAVYKEVR